MFHQRLGMIRLMILNFKAGMNSNVATRAQSWEARLVDIARDGETV